MIAVTFALSDESRDFTRILRKLPGTGPNGLPLLPRDGDPHELVLFHTGMGGERTLKRLRILWDSQATVDFVISAGYAGALDPVLPAGSLILAENYSHPELLSAAQAILKGRAHTGTMVTCEAALETVEAKAQLAKASGAIAVDMETAAIAAFCRENGVPLLSLRVISDTASEELAVPFSVCFDSKTERPRIGALLSFLFLHPLRIPAFVRFVRTVGRARRVLADALLEVAGSKWEVKSGEEESINSALDE